MTSGNFHPIPPEQIVVNREERQRKNFKEDKMSELIESINRIGLIHPLVVTRDLQLVAGERRLIAVKKLGWERVPCQYVDEVDDFVLQCIEFEENIKRSDLEWPEINAAIKRYHDMRVQYDPTWTQQQTAEAIGITPQWVSERMKAA